MRPLFAVVAGVVLATFGALILGEQPLEGGTVLVAGVLLGFAMAEVVAAVAKEGDGYLTAAVALLTEAGMVWGLYIATGHQLEFAAPEAWVAVALGSVAGALWFRTATRRAERSHPAS